MTTTNELVRSDCLGRIRVSVSQREAILDACETSGMSGPQFAAHHGVKYQTFATWLQKRRRADGGYPALPAPDNFPTLILAEVEAPVSERPLAATPLEIRLPGEA